VLGGTGRAGQLVVAGALQRGHEVVAYARRPEALEPRPGLTVVEGELADGDRLAAALRGCAAVVSLLGPGADRAGARQLGDGMRTLVAAMDAVGIRRLVATLTPSAPDPTDGRDRRVTALVRTVRFVLPDAYNAVRSMDEVVRTSGLRWTIVRIPVLREGAARPSARPRRIGQPGGLVLSRERLADFVLDVVETGTFVHEAPLLADG
jgi:uncharacterized protein YbjT (DUF2867 family)